jgi:hypothetical protein
MEEKSTATEDMTVSAIMGMNIFCLMPMTTRPPEAASAFISVSFRPRLKSAGAINPYRVRASLRGMKFTVLYPA